jgi:hypothetical protein
MPTLLTTRDAEVRVQVRDHLRRHRWPAIGVDGELSRLDSLTPTTSSMSFFARVALCVGDHPADDVATEDVQHDVQVVLRPLRQAEELRDAQLRTWFGSVASNSGFA